MSQDVEFDSVPTAGVVLLPPAPRSLEALGRNHTLEGAIAELVDNSIDAGARHVLIRFVQAERRLRQLVVVDDGSGMSGSEIDVAMTIGGERSYDEGEIGRFGFGMKAASFSQADVVTVLSRRTGEPAVGRRWRTERAKQDFACEVVEPEYSEAALSSEWDLPPAASGTIVRWDAVRGFPAVDDPEEVERFLSAAINTISSYLGLVYHRLISNANIEIFIDVQDVVLGPGARIAVRPLDPFRYPRSGVPGWPRELDIAASEPARLTCHVWPGRSQLEEFRLDGKPLERQGLYVYLNDRLIQCGGWNGLLQLDKQLNLARVALNLRGDVAGFLQVRPEKNGVETGPRFSKLVLSATFADGSDFKQYIEVARGYLKDSNRRQRLRKARLAPGSGFDLRLKRAIAREVPQRDGESLQMRWAPLRDGEFFHVDREESTLWLNKRYRSALTGGRSGALNDAPMLKMLLYLLVEEVFEGAHLGPRDKDNIEQWQTLLFEAAETELAND